MFYKSREKLPDGSGPLPRPRGDVYSCSNEGRNRCLHDWRCINDARHDCNGSVQVYKLCTLLWCQPEGQHNSVTATHQSCRGLLLCDGQYMIGIVWPSIF